MKPEYRQFRQVPRDSSTARDPVSLGMGDASATSSGLYRCRHVLPRIKSTYPTAADVWAGAAAVVENLGVVAARLLRASARIGMMS